MAQSCSDPLFYLIPVSDFVSHSAFFNTLFVSQAIHWICVRGFYGLVEPLSYVVTRVQNVLEPLVFLGPFVGLLVVLSFMQKSKHNFGSLAKFGVICFLGFIAAGAYYTGETARAAYYVIPPLIMFLGTKDILGKLSNKAKYFLLNAVMLQTVIMQVFFYWTW